MAASVSGGYDYKLVDKSLADEYTCPICMLVLRDPQLTRCGHHLCNCCLKQLKYKGRNHFKCPTCRDDLTNNFFPDKHINRKIKSLQVYCNNKDDGCQWKGDLKDIEDHLQECPYQLVSCSNDCGMNLQRRHLQNHLENDCPKRLIKCQYCNEEGRHQVITGDHLGVCPEYPTRCTNEGCGQLIPRHQMPSHKASCPKEMISCGYRSVGCEEKMKREEQEEHNEQWRERHLQLAVGEVNKLNSDIIVLNSTIAGLQKEKQLAVGEITNLTGINMSLQNKLQVAENKIIINNGVMKFSGYAGNKRTNTQWYSPGFYTSPGGYKMCLRVYANGSSGGEGTHVSCGYPFDVRRV
jgi:TNF receptor-associated factor 4